MTLPRTTIRTLLKEQAGDQPITDAVIHVVIDTVLADEDLVGVIMADVVRTEARKVRGDRAPAPRFDQPGHAHIAIPDKKRNILLDMANMDRLQLTGLAEDLESSAQKDNEWAALCRAVASQLQDGQTVGQRFTREDLLSLRSKLTVSTERRIYIGQREVPALSRTTTTT